MKRQEIEKIELDLLLEGIRRRYGYDFQNYSRVSLKRRLKYCLVHEKLNNISELIDKCLYDTEFFNSILTSMLVSVTEIFRDPLFFLEFRKKVVPVLKTHPFIKIWHAGCATGEEVYSMAILLKENNLLEKSTIYATDINVNALHIAKEGIYALEDMEKYAQNYTQAGGVCSLSDYYTSSIGYVKMHNYLKKKIVFSNHNLSTDGVFNEMNVILCRNVFIYFNRHLQDRAVFLFYDSLDNHGFLCLGKSETLHFLEAKKKFTFLSEKQRIYRRVALSDKHNEF
ncbi:MAG: Chemotaxis protein methyltransferase Cher2 [Chlamydiae bacterium]|nr:Chemotaxis protein methyltransferase Cher2 [Chlamydiota bacterium]